MTIFSSTADSLPAFSSVWPRLLNVSCSIWSPGQLLGDGLILNWHVPIAVCTHRGIFGLCVPPRGYLRVLFRIGPLDCVDLFVFLTTRLSTFTIAHLVLFLRRRFPSCFSTGQEGNLKCPDIRINRSIAYTHRERIGHRTKVAMTCAKLIMKRRKK